MPAGDVVIARSVQNPRHVVCKRVLGLEGDVVNIPSSTRWGLGRTVEVGGCHGTVSSSPARLLGGRHFGSLSGQLGCRVGSHDLLPADRRVVGGGTSVEGCQTVGVGSSGAVVRRGR